jgi:hypothetical protein
MIGVTSCSTKQQNATTVSGDRHYFINELFTPNECNMRLVQIPLRLWVALRRTVCRHEVSLSQLMLEVIATSPEARTHAVRCGRHCFIAPSMMRWLKWLHSSTRSSLWSVRCCTSRILVRYTLSWTVCTEPNPTHLVVDRVEIGTVWWLECRTVRWRRESHAFRDATVSCCRCAGGFLKTNKIYA